MADGPGGDLGAARQAELGEDVGHVDGRGLRRDEQPLGELAVGQARRRAGRRPPARGRSARRRGAADDALQPARQRLGPVAPHARPAGEVVVERPAHGEQAHRPGRRRRASATASAVRSDADQRPAEASDRDRRARAPRATAAAAWSPAAASSSPSAWARMVAAAGWSPSQPSSSARRDLGRRDAERRARPRRGDARRSSERRACRAAGRRRAARRTPPRAAVPVAAAPRPARGRAPPVGAGASTRARPRTRRSSRPGGVGQRGPPRARRLDLPPTTQQCSPPRPPHHCSPSALTRRSGGEVAVAEGGVELPQQADAEAELVEADPPADLDASRRASAAGSAECGGDAARGSC